MSSVGISFQKSPGGGGGDSDMKWTGMLVVSLRGVNFGFWSRLGCSGQNVIIFSRQGLVEGCTRRNNKKERILILYIYSVHINNKVHCNKMSLSIDLQECNTKLGDLHRTVI